METPTKHEQFRVIICAFRKYTTLSAGTASVSSEERHFLRGLQTRAIPAGVSVYFLHFCNQYSSFVSLFLLCPILFFIIIKPTDHKGSMRTNLNDDMPATLHLMFSFVDTRLDKAGKVPYIWQHFQAVAQMFDLFLEIHLHMLANYQTSQIHRLLT